MEFVQPFGGGVSTAPLLVSAGVESEGCLVVWEIQTGTVQTSAAVDSPISVRPPPPPAIAVFFFSPSAPLPIAQQRLASLSGGEGAAPNRRVRQPLLRLGRRINFHSVVADGIHGACVRKAAASGGARGRRPAANRRDRRARTVPLGLRLDPRLALHGRRRCGALNHTCSPPFAMRRMLRTERLNVTGFGVSVRRPLDLAVGCRHAHVQVGCGG